jgi:antitoxin (DNA-binding transcriptional repressor) of toxin-antitoxin stability system
MEQVSIDEAKERLLELIRAAHKGETVLITGGDEQAVQLIPVLAPKGKRHFGSAKGLIKMAEDFDAPLEDSAFDAYGVARLW